MSIRPSPPPGLISAAQRDRVLALLAGAPGHAKAFAGGNVSGRDGFSLEPTVVAGLRQDDALVGSYGLDDYTRVKHVAHAL